MRKFYINIVLFYVQMASTSIKFEQQILKKLDKLEREVEEIREHMVDTDTILTFEERRLLDESFVHEKEGVLISLEDVEDARRKTG